VIPPEMDPATSEVTRPSDLGFGPKGRTEIEVDAIQELPPRPGDDGMVEVRMAETIEEFTYGNPHHHYRLEQGKRYRVPMYIAQYLHSLGKIYERA
jgi:hypothetical protein